MSGASASKSSERTNGVFARLGFLMVTRPSQVGAAFGVADDFSGSLDFAFIPR